MTRALRSPQKPSSTTLLARLLDSPEFAALVPTLPAATLGRVIAEVGLEDAGELVAFATAEQLARVFDDDLWKSERPGEDERFDPERFLVWLSVLSEAGDEIVANRLAELPPDLVTLAFHRHLLVLDLDMLMGEIGEADEDEATRIEKALSNVLYEEIDRFQVVARRGDGWDDIVSALLALDRDHHDALVGILERCAAMSAEAIEDNGGLYEVLTSEEMLEADLLGEREDRRSAAGHVAPSQASAFLKIARRGDDTRERDPMTKAYFRNLRSDAAAALEAAMPALPERVAQILREAEGRDIPVPALAAPNAKLPLFREAMRAIAGEAVFFERSEEVAYLANALASGCSFQGRSFRPAEAVRAALATCSLGLELVAGTRLSKAVDALREQSADRLFRIGWNELYRKLVMRAAETAERMLKERSFQREADDLRAARLSGEPWRARRDVELLNDDFLLDLVDECPTINGEFIEEKARAREIGARLR